MGEPPSFRAMPERKRAFSYKKILSQNKKYTLAKPRSVLKSIILYIMIITIGDSPTTSLETCKWKLLLKVSQGPSKGIMTTAKMMRTRTRTRTRMLHSLCIISPLGSFQRILIRGKVYFCADHMWDQFNRWSYVEFVIVAKWVRKHGKDLKIQVY